MKCMILASGFGTRMYPLTLNIAKALLPYKGKPMINHIVDKIPPDIEILVNINKKFEEDFRDWSERQERHITLCVEEIYSNEQRLGAIGSLCHWIKKKNIKEGLLLFGCDNYFEFDLSAFMSAFNSKNVLIAVYDVGDVAKATQYGVVKLEGSRVLELEEKPAHPRSSTVSTACWILPAKIYPYVAEFCGETRRDNLGNFITYLLERDKIYAFPFKETWIDIGDIDIYEATK